MNCNPRTENNKYYVNYGISTLLGIPEELNTQKDSKNQNIAEGIVDGYDWSQTRKLMLDDRKLMLERLQFKDVSNIEIKRLYETFTKLKISDTRFSQEDIFAIIMNIALKREAVEKVELC